MNRITNYFRQSWNELSKVVWPSRKTAIRYTAAVLIFALAFAAFLGLIDLALTELFQKVILKG